MFKGKPPEYIKALSDSVHKALVEAYEMPSGDRFQIIDQFEPGTLIFDRNYWGGPRSDDFLLISITSGERVPKVKEAFFKRLVETLSESPGVRPEDVFVHLDCTAQPEDWSFSNGVPAAKMIRVRLLFIDA